MINEDILMYVVFGIIGLLILIIIYLVVKMIFFPKKEIHVVSIPTRRKGQLFRITKRRDGLYETTDHNLNIVDNSPQSVWLKLKQYFGVA